MSAPSSDTTGAATLEQQLADAHEHGNRCCLEWMQESDLLRSALRQLASCEPLSPESGAGYITHEVSARIKIAQEALQQVADGESRCCSGTTRPESTGASEERATARPAAIPAAAPVAGTPTGDEIEGLLDAFWFRARKLRETEMLGWPKGSEWRDALEGRAIDARRKISREFADLRSRLASVERDNERLLMVANRIVATYHPADRRSRTVLINDEDFDEMEAVVEDVLKRRRAARHSESSHD